MDTRQEFLYREARIDHERYERDIRSNSGADRAESEFYRMRRKFWIALSEHKPYTEALAEFDREWREYAEQNNAKVSAAPKIKRGPMSGHSTISARWVSPDKVQADVSNLLRTSQVADTKEAP